MSLPSPVNPFEESADPRGFVPRAVCEGVLGTLERHISAGVPAILLRGPAGIGKSMLLAVLHQRLSEVCRIAHVSVSLSPSMEISHRILDLLDVNVDDDPSSSLVAAAEMYAASGKRTLVIIDQATHVPVASSHQLARAAARAGGDLCILFAVTEEDGAEAFEREIGAEVELATIRFDSPMNAQETSEYIAQRLEQTLDSQVLRDRFDDAALRYVIAGAGGNPRRVNELAYDALRRLESGEGLPVRYRDADASGEFDAGGPATPPEEVRSQPQAPAYEEAPHPQQSLGGALLGGAPARDPHELDSTRELFPPGFLTSGRQPLAPPDMRGPGGTSPTSAPGDAETAAAAETTATAEGAAAAETTAAAEGAAAAETTAAAEGAAAAEATAAAERAAAVETTTAAERTAAPVSSKRPTLWVAALMVTAVAGGYFAGRIDRVSTEAPLASAAPRVPVARDPEPMLPEPQAPREASGRAVLDVPDQSAVVAASIPATHPDTMPAASIDSGSDSSLADAKPAAATRSQIDTASAEPAGQHAAVAVEPATPTPAPPAAVPAAVRNVSPNQARSIPPKPKPVSKPEPRAERVRVASDSSAGKRPQPPRAPAAGAAVAGGRAAADGSVTAIVVGTQSTTESGARASAYVRVQVQLEPGAILTIDGERVGVAPFSDLIMQPGPHTFVAELPDGLQIEQLIQVSADTGVVEF